MTTNLKSRFTPRMTTYKCTECGKTTRDTGRGEGHTGFCYDCFNAMSLENEHNDDGHSTPVVGCPLCSAEKSQTSTNIAININGEITVRHNEKAARAFIRKQGLSVKDFIKAPEARIWEYYTPEPKSAPKLNFKGIATNQAELTDIIDRETAIENGFYTYYPAFVKGSLSKTIHAVWPHRINDEKIYPVDGTDREVQLMDDPHTEITCKHCIRKLQGLGYYPTDKDNPRDFDPDKTSLYD